MRDLHWRGSPQERIHKGLHQPIIEREVWEKAQALLAGHVRGGRRGPRGEHNSVLAGGIVDVHGEPLIATHACKGKVRYRYYVSRDLQTTPGAAGLRLPAREIETVAAARVADLFADASHSRARNGSALRRPTCPPSSPSATFCIGS